MADWNQHLYLNKLVNYWNTRELDNEERKVLYIKSVLNYQGYWINALIHIIPFYLYYKRGFLKVSNSITFWKNTFILVSVTYLSKLQIDHIFNLSLGFEIQKLSDKYESPKDELRRKYQSEKPKHQMERMMKYEELRDKGGQVSDLIVVSIENR